MTDNEKERLINDLRRWMDGVDDDEVYGRMQAALRRIRAWEPGNDDDPMPYRSEIEMWASEHGEVVTALAKQGSLPVKAIDPTPPDADISTSLEEEAKPTDPDDHLQPAFDNAKLRMEGGAYYDAMRGFREIVEMSHGRLRQPAEELWYQAKAEMEQQKAPLLDIARTAPPDEMEAAWSKIRDIDPDDSEAAAALDTMQSQAGVERTRRRVEEMGKEADEAFERQRLEGMNLLVMTWFRT